MGIKSFFANYAAELKQNVRYPGYSYPGPNTGYGSFTDLVTSLGAGSTLLSPARLAQEVGNMEHIAAVCAVNNWATRSLQEPPVVVKEVREDGTDETVLGHELPFLLDTLNPYMDYADFIDEYWWGKTTDGNSYFVVFTDKTGTPREIWPLPYWLVKPRWRNGTSAYVDFFQYDILDGYTANYLPAAVAGRPDVEQLAAQFRCEPYAYVIHFKNRRRRGRTDADVNLRQGTPLFASIVPELAGDQKSILFQLALLENGGMPKLIISPRANTIVDAKQVNEIAKEVKARTTGTQTGNALVMGVGMQAEKLTFSPAELDVSKLREATQNALCQLINVDPSVIKFSVQAETGTKANRKQASEDAARRFLRPEWSLIAKQLTAQLLPLFEPDKERLKRLRVEYDLRKVLDLQEDEDLKANRKRKDLVTGAIRLRDYQQELGLPVDKDADYYLMPKTLEIVTDEVRRKKIEAGVEGIDQSLKPAPPVVEAVPEKELPIEYRAQFKAHSYATTQIVLPEPEARKAQSFVIADEDLADDGRENLSHITCKYGLHGDDPDAVRRLIGNEPPVQLTFGKTATFKGEEFDVLYISVESEDLQRLNKLLTDNLACTTTHASYTPHCTIAYLKPGKGESNLLPNKLEGVRMTVDVVEFRDRLGNKTDIKLSGMREPK